MPKRRRERDKPKNAPDSAYDPNKRVLLSYGSDDEDVEVATREVEKAAELAVDESRLANYQMTEYPDDEEEGEVTSSPAIQVAPTSEIKSKKATTSASTQQKGLDGTEVERVREEDAPQSITFKQNRTTGKARDIANPDTGQRLALGAAPRDHDEDEDEEEFDSTTKDALAYLNSVREERQAIPEVLAATRQVLDNHDHEGEEDEADEGYLIEEDSYIASPAPPAPEADVTDPRYVFTKALQDRFLLQRKHLHMNTGTTKLVQPGDDCPIFYQAGNRKQYAQWLRVLGTKSPMPAQLRSMSQDTVFRLLELLQETHLVKGKNINTVTSAWIWSLLCRLDDVGSMSNDQVFPLRELGKRVVFLQLHFSDPETAAQLEALERQEQDETTTLPADAESGASAGDEVDAGAAIGQEAATPSTELTKADHADATENTLATLDMILVVVGEVFGQRDLLEFRQPWTTAEAETEA